MKKKCLECVVLLLFIFALTHGIIQNTQPLKETKEVQTEYEEKTSQVTEKSQETEPEVQDLENQILRTASESFFRNIRWMKPLWDGLKRSMGAVCCRVCIHSWKTEIRAGSVVSVYRKQHACSVAYVLQAATVYVIFV